MTQSKAKNAICPVHGAPTKRSSCLTCNAAYMREYLQRRRIEAPAHAVWERARRRARRLGLIFALPRDSIFIPETCPVLGIPLTVGKGRCANSPSLDRIKPADGYVPQNVRVVSDLANRLKGDRDKPELQMLADRAAPHRRAEFKKVADYVDREGLLAEVRKKAALGGPAGQEWQKIALFLDRVFRDGLKD